MAFRAWSVTWVLVSACIDSSSVTCGDGRLCPTGTTCVAIPSAQQQLCVDPEQIAQCTDKTMYAHCGADGRCHDGVCLPVSCGNGRVDRADPADALDIGESCDDGNQLSNDGCSSDCTSNETCGNGVADLVKGELCDNGNLISHDGCDSRCLPEQVHWAERSAIAPELRTDYMLAYDTARLRVVLFGGESVTTGLALGDTWEWDGSAWIEQFPPTSPDATNRRAMAYDGSRHRTVMFDGVTTWEWDGVTWTAVPVGLSPPARYSFAMTYDAKRHVVVLYGGFQIVTGSGVPSGTPVFDTWEWNGTTWTNIVGPAPDVTVPANAMTYDPTRGVVVLFDGGISLWEYDGSWSSISPGSFPPSRGTPIALVYDAAARRVLLAGGSGYDDMWTWDGTTWEMLAAVLPVAGAPTLVSDPTHQHVIGFDPVADPVVVWDWNGTAWSSLPASDAPNAGRAVLVSAHDAARGRTVFFGEAGCGTCTTSEFDGAGWTRFAPLVTPGGRRNSTIAYDPDHHLTVLYNELGETWTWDGGVWTPLTPAQSPPARAEARLGYDGHQLVLFGGVDGTVPLGETWTWNGATWTAITVAGPSPRFRVALAYDPIRKQLVLFGGDLGPTSTADDTWVWNGASWAQRSVMIHPAARAGASMAWDASRRRLVLYGGDSATGALSDAWEWDGSGWSIVPVGVLPPPRGHPAVFPTHDGAGVMMFGGSLTASQSRTDLWRLRWDNLYPTESCETDLDLDGDGLAGCDDPDCWATCSSSCPPGTSCDPAAPRCGDGACNPALETCWSCPDDCPCAPVCGDFVCDPGETATTCPGDC